MGAMDHNHPNPLPHHPGYWSPQTSAANFCEIDYERTFYIAEFINTLSNLAYIWQGVITLPPSLRGHGREIQLHKWPVENLALLLVGVGSAAFHMTLLHEMQIVDESGMYAVVGALDYRLWAVGMGEGMMRGLFGAVLGVVSVGVIGWNAVGTEDGKASNAVHLGLFIALVTGLWPRVLWMIRRQKAGREGSERERRSGYLMREYQKGVVWFFAGFALWLFEGQFCGMLRQVRAVVGVPLCWTLELHGWWHFLTALGAGRFVWVARELTTWEAEEKGRSMGNGHVKRS